MAEASRLLAISRQRIGQLTHRGTLDFFHRASDGLKVLTTSSVERYLRDPYRGKSGRPRNDSLLSIGRRFGYLRISHIGENGSCRCRCDCGRYIETTATKLRAGLIASCGCAKEVCRKQGMAAGRSARQELRRATVLAYASSLLGQTHNGWLSTRAETSDNHVVLAIRCTTCGAERAIAPKTWPPKFDCRECRSIRAIYDDGLFSSLARCRLSNGYIGLYVGKSDTRADCCGMVAEHRLVMERGLGRPLSGSEEVHHHNNVRDDNRPENLSLVANRMEHFIADGRSVGRVNGGLLRQLRQSKNLTGKQLSEISGVPVYTIRQLERHSQVGCAPNALIGLSMALNVEPELLLVRE